jgi:hypothetical protein
LDGIAVFDTACARLGDNSTRCWGYNRYSVLPIGLDTFAAVTVPGFP